MDKNYLARDKTGRVSNPGKGPKTYKSSRYIINVVNNSTALQIVVHFLLLSNLNHLQGSRVGIKNWPGCVSRYKHYRKDNLSWLCYLIKSSSGQPIFYMSVGRIMRLAQKIVLVVGFVSQYEPWKGPVEHRGTN